MPDLAVSALASWMSWGLARGLLRPLEVHGRADGPTPSKKTLTMSPELIEAMAYVAERDGWDQESKPEPGA